VVIDNKHAKLFTSCMNYPVLIYDERDDALHEVAVGDCLFYLSLIFLSVCTSGISITTQNRGSRDRKLDFPIASFQILGSVEKVVFAALRLLNAYTAPFVFIIANCVDLHSSVLVLLQLFL